jgi:putative phage-type endonuclease
VKIVDVTQGTPEWLAHRREGIGSSDIAAIMGKCNYRSAMDAFKDKIGVSDPIYVNPAMRRGQENESEAGDWLSSKLQIQGHTNPCIEHPQFSFLHSSLDFYDAKSGIIGEIKVPMPKTFSSLFQIKTAWDDYIDRYKFQLQWHMAVSGKEKIWFVVYSPEHKKAYTKEIIRDDVLIKEMMDKATEFWNNLQAGILPECEDTDMIVLNPPEAKEVCGQ